MNIIVAVDDNWGIGKDNELLIHIPEDLKHFKEKTLNKIVVMGRKTLESLPNKQPLKGRYNIVLTSDKDYKADCKVCNNYNELKEELNNYSSRDIFIIGGSQIYNDTLQLCDTFYVTKIYEKFDADKFFPNLDEINNIKEIWKSDIKEYKGIKYQFFKYKKELNGKENKEMEINNNIINDEQTEELLKTLNEARSVNTRILNDSIEREERNEELVEGEVMTEINLDNNMPSMPIHVDSLSVDTNTTLDDLTDIDSSLINDMKITTEMIGNADKTKDLSDKEALELLNFINSYESNPKFDIYNNMPKFMKNMTNELFKESGGGMSKKEIAKIVTDSLIQEIKMDQAFFDLNESIKNELKIPSMTELYAEFMKENFEEKFLEVANQIENENPEKAELLRGLSKTYSTTYTFEELIKGLNNRKVRQFIKDPSKFNKMCNGFNNKYINSRFMITDIKLCYRVLTHCLPEIDDEYIKKFIMLICKVCENKNPDDINDHVFMYYTVQNIRLLEHEKFNEAFEDIRSDMYNIVIENIKKVIEEIKSREAIKVKK